MLGIVVVSGTVAIYFSCLSWFYHTSTRDLKKLGANESDIKCCKNWAKKSLKTAVFGAVIMFASFLAR